MPRIKKHSKKEKGPVFVFEHLFVIQGGDTTMSCTVPSATVVNLWSSSLGSFSSLIKGSRYPLVFDFLDKLRGSLIRGVADPPTKSQAVKANFGWSKFLTAVVDGTVQDIVVSLLFICMFGSFIH